AVLGHRGQLRHERAHGHVELVRIAERAERLLLERRGPAVPEERLLPGQVEEVRRVAAQGPAGDAGRGTLAVTAAQPRPGDTPRRPRPGPGTAGRRRTASCRAPPGRAWRPCVPAARARGDRARGGAPPARPPPARARPQPGGRAPRADSNVATATPCAPLRPL